MEIFDCIDFVFLSEVIILRIDNIDTVPVDELDIVN